MKIICDTPGNMTPEAARFYNELTEMLTDVGIIKDSDIQIVTMLAQNLALNRMAYEKIHPDNIVITKPSGIWAINPWYKIYCDTGRAISALSDKLGMNPVARARIKIDEKPSDQETDGFLKQSKN